MIPVLRRALSLIHLPNAQQDEILGWNKNLMSVADVNQIMSEIQRTWSYLESLFIAR